jgi:NAD-dependent dihydropyrimidine dehydrogenase PreA subunit/flavodoxin
LKALLCYYSGSGNTELACRYLADTIENCLIEMLNIEDGGVPELDGYDAVGFATFANFWAPSALMSEFIAALPAQQRKPAFVMSTFGMVNGSTTRIMADSVTGRGFTVVASHALHTPENYPPMISKGLGNVNAPSERELGSYRRFIDKLGVTLGRIGAGEPVAAKGTNLRLLGRLIPNYPRDKAASVMGPKAVDESRCTACGICAAACPRRAIRLDPKPVFDESKCSGCWRCYNQCLMAAISTSKLGGEHQYPQPSASLRDKLS